MSNFARKLKRRALPRMVAFDGFADDCPLCRMAAAEGHETETIELSDGSTLSISRFPENWRPPDGMAEAHAPDHNARGRGAS